MEKIKIVFIIDELNLGGTELQLVSVIKRLNRNRFLAYLICLRDSEYLKATQLDCEKIILNVGKLLSLKGIRKLFWLAHFVRKEKIHILQTFFIDANIFGVIGGTLGGVPVIISSRRDLGFWYNSKLLWVLRILDRWVDHYLVNSISVRDHVLKYEKMVPQKVSVIYNGIDLEPFRRVDGNLRSWIRRKLGISLDDIAIGIVSNLNRPVKRVDLFLKAAGEVYKEHKNTSFWVIGDGNLKGELRQLSSTLGIRGKTHFLGLKDDVIPYLAAFDIGVLTSDSEGFPNSILEYMAAGVPVVATNSGGTSEIIENDSTGILVPPGDYKGVAEGISSLLFDRSKQISMGEEAKRVVQEKYAWDVKIKELEAYYCSVIRN